MDFCAVTSVNLLGYIVDFKNRFTHKSGHKSLLWFQFCIKLMLGCLQKNVRGLCIKLLTTVIFGPLRHDGLWLLTDYGIEFCIIHITWESRKHHIYIFYVSTYILSNCRKDSIVSTLGQLKTNETWHHPLSISHSSIWNPLYMHRHTNKIKCEQC